ncbi:YheC/YheD family protein [Bacillus sp. B15-48]|uniref:YheC/YheD family protein n=1 Tax=Bacillus sp. B15-48 TaxID=1548601 RepID=UPI00193FDFC7|nr:YheC/YheD family protein [Bacillus sp. B15-48]
MVTFKSLISKWKKTKLLRADPELRPFIAETIWFTKRNLRHMLNKYNLVFVKPSRGSLGRGIIKVQKELQDKRTVYSYHYKKRKETFSTLSGLHRALKQQIAKIFARRKRTKKSYLIQQGIPLLKYKDRLFDIRSIVQLNSNNEWVTTGIVCRVGHPKKIVTNYSSGGTPMRYEDVMRKLVPEENISFHRQQIERLSIKMAKKLSEECPALRILGFDLGYDSYFNPWLIEVNLTPRFKSFKRIDMDTYKKIKHLFSGYPRTCR